MVSLLEPLQLIISRLTGDATLTALVPAASIRNHLPQDAPLPFIRAVWVPANDWDTKSSDGIEGEYQIHIWVDSHGDKVMLDIADAVYAALHNLPFTSAVSAQSLLLRFTNMASFLEPDGVSHHGAMTFNHIFTD